jgi:hypothetical protein
VAEQEHDIDLVDGSTAAFTDRLIVAVKNGLAIPNGSATQSLAVTFLEGLPATYAVFVTVNGAVATAFTTYITAKTSAGFTVNCVGTTSSTTVDVLVIG